MALTKQIEIKGAFAFPQFYIGLFDSNGNAYNFSPVRNSDRFVDGVMSTTAELSLNDDLVGSVTVAPPHNYGGMVSCSGGSSSNRLYDLGLWLDRMLYIYCFFDFAGQSGPYSIILTFSNAIDIGNVAIFQDKQHMGDKNYLADLEVKIIGENQSVLASTVYTAQQQSLDYPKEVIATLTPEIPFSAPFVALNIKPTLPALPKTIKVINKDGRIYIKPKQA